MLEDSQYDQTVNLGKCFKMIVLKQKKVKVSETVSSYEAFVC